MHLDALGRGIANAFGTSHKLVRDVERMARVAVEAEMYDNDEGESAVG